MPLTAEQRKQLIDGLTTNCECWKGQGDREILNSLPDEKLQALDEQQQAIAVANTAVNGFSDGEREYRVNPETGKWESRVVENRAVDDDGEPNTSTGKTHRKAKKGGKDHEGHADNDDDDEDDDMESNSRSRSRLPRRQMETMDDWAKVAPADVQNTFLNAKRIVDREKDAIITKIIANSNTTESERQAKRAWLQNQSLEDLQRTLSLLPSAAVVEDIATETGRSSKPTRNRAAGTRRQDDGDDMLRMPVMNWQEMGKGGSEGQQQATAGATGTPTFNSSDEDEDEWLRNAPPSIRDQVENAKSLVEGQRRQLIDQIVENADEDEENKIRFTFGNKPISELRQIVNLLPKKTQAQRNYFGAQGAPATTNTAVSGVNDELLPLPSMDWLKDKTG